MSKVQWSQPAHVVYSGPFSSATYRVLDEHSLDAKAKDGSSFDGDVKSALMGVAGKVANAAASVSKYVWRHCSPYGVTNTQAYFQNPGAAEVFPDRLAKCCDGAASTADNGQTMNIDLVHWNSMGFMWPDLGVSFLYTTQRDKGRVTGCAALVIEGQSVTPVNLGVVRASGGTDEKTVRGEVTLKSGLVLRFHGHPTGDAEALFDRARAGLAGAERARVDAEALRPSFLHSGDQPKPQSRGLLGGFWRK